MGGKKPDRGWGEAAGGGMLGVLFCPEKNSICIVCSVIGGFRGSPLDGSATIAGGSRSTGVLVLVLVLLLLLEEAKAEKGDQWCVTEWWQMAGLVLGVPRAGGDRGQSVAAPQLERRRRSRKQQRTTLMMIAPRYSTLLPYYLITLDIITRFMRQ